jgi:hypothetical protein
MYLNVAPSAPAGLSGTRFIALPTIITPRAVVRGMGVLMLRSRGVGRGLRGLGARGLGLDNTALATANINRDFSSYINNLGYSVEQGQVVPVDVMKAGLVGRVQEVCNDTLTGEPACDPAAFQSQVDALAQQYADALAAQQAKTAALVASGSIAVPAGYYGGQDLYNPNYAPVGAPAAAAAAAPAGQSLGVRIENLSGGSSSSFKVGDQWRLTITGPANSPVTGSSNHNGQSNAAAPFGNTNASGVAVLTGSMAADTVGNWSEQWFVAGQPAGSISFTVAAPAAATQQQQQQTGGGSGTTGQQQQQQQQQQTGGGGGTTTGFNLSSLTGQTSLAGFSLPLWGWLAIAGVGVYAVSRGKS